MFRALSEEPLKTSSHGFNFGDLVWGKNESDPWWPGQICDEALAISSACVTKQKGRVLVAFFGDKTYGWLDPGYVVPFEYHFAQKSKLSGDCLFLAAVEEALLEIKKRSALGLTCNCRNPSTFRPTAVEGFFEVMSGFAAGSVYSIEQIEKARNDFRPHEMLSFVRRLALTHDIAPQKTISWMKNMGSLLAYREAVYGKSYEKKKHSAEISHGKDKADEEDITLSSLVRSRKRAPAADSWPPPPLSAPRLIVRSASPPPKKRFKGRKDPVPVKVSSEERGSISGTKQAPNAITFPSSSVLLDRSHGKGRDFLRGIASNSDRHRADNLTKEDIRAQFSSYLSKASILAGSLLNQWEASDALEEKYNKLKEDYSKLHATYSILSSKHKEFHEKRPAIIQNQSELVERNLEEAREEARRQVYMNFPNTEEGRALLQANWESRKQEFLNSLEFKHILAKKALPFYYHGFDSCQKQFARHGYPPEGITLDFLDRDAGLPDLPDEGKEYEDEGQNTTAVKGTGD